MIRLFIVFAIGVLSSILVEIWKIEFKKTTVNLNLKNEQVNIDIYGRNEKEYESKNINTYIASHPAIYRSSDRKIDYPNIISIYPVSTKKELDGQGGHPSIYHRPSLQKNDSGGAKGQSLLDIDTQRTKIMDKSNPPKLNDSLSKKIEDDERMVLELIN